MEPKEHNKVRLSENRDWLSIWETLFLGTEEIVEGVTPSELVYGPLTT